MRIRPHKALQPALALASLAFVCFGTLGACAKSDDELSGSAAGKAGSDAGADQNATGGADSSAGSGGSPSGGSAGNAGSQTTGGTAGGAGEAGAAGIAGEAGASDAGPDAGCTLPSDCPAPANECQLPTCTNGVCGTTNAPAGTVPSTQTVGDCHKLLCDGQGSTVSSNDDTDLPDDQKTCTTDSCSNGTPIHTPLPAGTSCGTGLMCDSTGNCVGCSVPTDCSGQDTECKTRTCTAGACGMSFAPAGKKLSSQTSGDCKVQQCDGQGNIVTVSDNSDVPIDNKQCTSDVCTAGTASNPPSPAGTTCSEGGGVVCNGSGTCVACITATNCPGTDTECSKRTCVSNACGVSFTAAGTPTSTQTTGDCKTTVCNGSGGITTNVNDSDLPVDGSQCTNDVCTSGTPSNPPLASGTPCSDSGGKVCNGSGFCVECVKGSDCASGICSGNVCSAIVCGSGTVDCDGLGSNGCECSGDTCCGTSCPLQHQNGLGQTYFDCSPLGVPGTASTYSLTMATKARAAWPQTGTDAFASCVGPSGGDVVYRQTATSCAVWAYTKTIAGRVRLNTADNQCLCPSTTGTTWN